MTRRDLLRGLPLGVLWTHPFPAGAMQVTDKEALLNMFDRAGIDVDDPSKDDTKHAISIQVNGSEVIGTEGGMAVFKFTPGGKLTGVVVWNHRLLNEGTDQ